MRNTKYLLYLLITGTCQSSQQINYLAIIPYELIIKIEMLTNHNYFELFIDQWKINNYEIDYDNTKIKKKLRKAIAKTYASSNLACSSKTLYLNFFKNNWQKQCKKENSFIILWQQIPTLKLSLLCDDLNYYNQNNRLPQAFLFDGGDCAERIKNGTETEFAIVSNLLNIDLSSDKYQKMLTSVGKKLYQSEGPIIFTFMAKKIESQLNNQDLKKMFQQFFISNQPLIDENKMPSICPLSQAQKRFLKILLPSPNTKKYNNNLLRNISLVKSKIYQYIEPKTSQIRYLLLNIQNNFMITIKRALSYIKNLLQNSCAD